LDSVVWFASRCPRPVHNLEVKFRQKLSPSDLPSIENFCCLQSEVIRVDFDGTVDTKIGEMSVDRLDTVFD
jgi:hypothetical protein